MQWQLHLLSGCGNGTSVSQGGLPASPLATYLGFGHHPVQEGLQFNADELAREQLISNCMKEACFEYTPEPAGKVIMTNDAGEQVELGQSGAEAERTNEAYVKSLSGERQTAYWLALTDRESPDQGISADEMKRLDSDSDGRISYEESLGHGCRGEATAAIPGVFFVQRVLGRDFDDLQDDIVEQRKLALGELRACEPLKKFTVDLEDREVVEVLEAIVATGGSDATEAARCLSQYEAVVASAMLKIEQAFYSAHADIIREFAVPYA